MKIISILTIALLSSFIGQTQVDKFKFEVDGEQWLRVRKNAGGYNIIHQYNNTTSMFFGFNSGLNNIEDPMIFGSGENNTAYGFATLADNTTGFRNTAIGSGALDENLTGNINTAIGFSAMGDAIDASHNVAIGKSALLSNLNGDFNVAVGNDAFNTTNHAERSVSIGSTAGSNDTSSVDNVYVGFGAGRGTVFATDGYDRMENVMVGSYAGYSCETNGNVFLGHSAGINAKAANQLYITNDNTDSLNTLIYGQFDNDYLRFNGEVNIDGLYTMPTTAPNNGDILRATGGSGDLTWYDLDVSWEYGAGDDVVYEDGDVGIGIGNPIYRLDVADNVNNGYVARFRNSNTASASKGIIIQTGPITNPTSSSYYALFLDGNGSNIGGIRGNGAGGTMYSTTSDRRLKQNIKTFDKGLSTLAKINPTIYQRKSNPTQDEIGFIAQELQKVLPLAVGGNPTDDIEESPMTVDYGRITPVIVAAVKEQQQLIEKQRQQIEDQQDVIEKMIKRMDTQALQFKALKAEISSLQGVAEN